MLFIESEVKEEVGGKERKAQPYFSVRALWSFAKMVGSDRAQAPKIPAINLPRLLDRNPLTHRPDSRADSRARAKPPSHASHGLDFFRFSDTNSTRKSTTPVREGGTKTTKVEKEVFIRIQKDFEKNNSNTRKKKEYRGISPRKQPSPQEKKHDKTKAPKKPLQETERERGRERGRERIACKRPKLQLPNRERVDAGCREAEKRKRPLWAAARKHQCSAREKEEKVVDPVPESRTADDENMKDKREILMQE